MIDLKNLDKNIDSVLDALETVQENEKDERDKARECKIFVTKKDGQWEQRIWDRWGAERRPRYTYDKVTPILDSLVGELEQNEFSAVVSPAGGEATKETASMLDSLIRSIQNWSDAKFTYKKIARNLATTGYDCCRAVHDFRDENSFDQDLIVKYIPNSIDRVWFDPNSEEQDRSDADWCIILQGFTKEQYEKKWPKGSGSSVDVNRQLDYYANGKRELVIVGELLFKKRAPKTLVQMSNGAVYDKAEAQPILDELQEQGVEIVKEREADDITVFSRIFDGDDWIEDEKETVFSILPVVPFYHCFEVVEDKLTWRRIVEKLMDPARILNYGVSRKIEEGALSPRKKIAMTKKQMEGHEAALSTLNTNADPILPYNVDKDAPPPYEIGTNPVNPSLQETVAEAAAMIETTAGMYAASLAKNPGAQSGIALEMQQNKGDTGNSSFYVDMAKGITYLCKVLLDGAPKVYDTRRDIPLLNADGSTEVKTINDTFIDDDTQEVVSVNNLAGNFSVMCDMGPMFRNRMEQGNAALLDLAGVLPNVLETSADIFTRNITAPGMDQVSERIRVNLFNQGLIPPDQMTEQEKEQLAQQQQAEAEAAAQPDPLTIQTLNTLQAQEAESVANAQQSAAKSQSDQVTSQAKLLDQMNKEREQDRRDFETRMEQSRKDSEANNKEIKTMAETLKILREAMGVDQIVGPHNTEAYIEQAALVQEAIPGDASQIIDQTPQEF
ncbi:MAG: portal protein [Candidatus Bathyarchaeia archaeon]